MSTRLNSDAQEDVFWMSTTFSNNKIRFLVLYFITCQLLEIGEVVVSGFTRHHCTTIGEVSIDKFMHRIPALFASVHARSSSLSVE